MRDVEDLPKIFCPRCGEEIGEECYSNDVDEIIVGCDQCCSWDMEQDGCPSVENQGGGVIGLDKYLSAVSYWELMERAIEDEENMMLFHQESQWDDERAGI